MQLRPNPISKTTYAMIGIVFYLRFILVDPLVWIWSFLVQRLQQHQRLGQAKRLRLNTWAYRVQGCKRHDRRCSNRRFSKSHFSRFSSISIGHQIWSDPGNAKSPTVESTKLPNESRSESDASYSDTSTAPTEDYGSLLNYDPENPGDTRSATESTHSDDTMTASVLSFKSLDDANPSKVATENSRSSQSSSVDMAVNQRDIRKLLAIWAHQACIPMGYEKYIIFNAVYPRTKQEVRHSVRRLENCCRHRTVLSNLLEFQLYGTREMFQYDMLKVWVNFGTNLACEDIWPPTYVPTSLEEDMQSHLSADTLF